MIIKTALNMLRVIRVGVIVLTSGVLWSKKTRGKKLIRCLQRLGPSFVKLGQTLSVRPDIVGRDLANSLSDLRDNLPPFSYILVQKTINREFGKTVDELFAEFDIQPIAAASIAQVHKAVTNEGKMVAVKVLRPKIKRKFQRDIELLYFMARIIDWFKAKKRLKLPEVVALFERSVKIELDLRMEAASASLLKDNTKADEGIYVPEIYWDYTTQYVMTSEWIDGTPIHHTDTLKEQGHNMRQLATYVAYGFFNQAYRDGFFHADMHPGNVFVDSKGRIVPVDFGIMGHLDHNTKLFVAEILRGFIQADYDHVADVHFRAGYVPAHQSKEAFAIACRAIGEPINGLPAQQISVGKLLGLLFKITEDFDMQTQPQLLLFQKTMVIIEGLAMELDPDINLWELAEPWIEDWAKQHFSLEAQLKKGAKDICHVLHRLPERLKSLDEIIETLTSLKEAS